MVLVVMSVLINAGVVGVGFVVCSGWGTAADVIVGGDVGVNIGVGSVAGVVVVGVVCVAVVVLVLV